MVPSDGRLRNHRGRPRPAGPGSGPGFGYVPDVGLCLAVFAAYFLVGAVAVFLYGRRELVA